MPIIQPPEVRDADKPADKPVLLGVVSATAGLGAAGWIAGLVTGSAAAAVSGTSGR